MDHVQCNHCATHLGSTAPRCSECKCAYYCSSKCQTDDWSNRHQLECIGMKTRREETEKRAAERLRQAALTKFAGKGGDPVLQPPQQQQQQQPQQQQQQQQPQQQQQGENDPENEEGHQRRLQRYREEAQVVVGPGEIVYFKDRRRYGVGIERTAEGEPYPVTVAGYVIMEGKYSFLQDTDGNVFRRRYVVPARGRPVFDDAVWWQTYSRVARQWEPMPRRVDPETNVKWEIYLP